jgi:hypothetical protein
MSPVDQKHRFDRQPLTSGVPRSTDIPGRSRHVANVPIGNIVIACERLFGGASSAVLVFATPQNTVLSLIFVALTYFGPGMFKSFVTLRTGNDWVHALGDHAVAPRALVDTPLIVKALGIG